MAKKSSNKGKKPTSAPTTRSRSKSKSHESSHFVTNYVNFGGEGWGENPPLLKTPEEVLAELTTNDNENSGGSPLPPPPRPSPTVGEGQSGGAVASMIAIASVVAMANATAIAVGGGGSVIVGAGVGLVTGAVKKNRRSSAVKNPPSGIPTCPICFKTFASWKGAFGHMRKHPERDYRGFFKPPTFSSFSSTPTSVAGEGISTVLGNREGGSGSSTIRGLMFDLNIPLDDASDEENDGNEGNREGLDLNEFPTIDEEKEEDEAA